MPAATCDLHVHTYYSDGRASPEELIKYASRLGLRTIALTDHDSTRGYREAAPIAASLGIELIPAIEFTCCWYDCDSSPGSSDIDVLGYFIHPDTSGFRAAEEAALADIHQRMEKTCSLLTSAGYPVSLAEVFAHNPRYAGIKFLIDEVIRKGYAPDWNQGLALIDRFYPQVRSSRFHIDQIIAAIHTGGGAAVLAHPTVVQCSGRQPDANRIAALVDMGLDGIEIYHHRLNKAARQYYLKLARRFNLAISGGSDEHGWPEGFPHLGSQAVTQAMVAELRQRASQYAPVNLE